MEDQAWQDLLIAWMHDPPDKAIRIPGHEVRARLYLEAAIGREIGESEIKGLPDQLASGIERLPLPKDGEDRRVNFEPGKKARCVHPLSGIAYEIEGGAMPGEEEIEGIIRGIVEGLRTNRERFLALWRLLPERLPGMRLLPADTRIPDHTILQHMDTSAAYQTADRGDTALLSFKLGPVQAFIEAARKTRDLLSGSYVLSWLVFEAMKPVLAECGPTALIYPCLRGAPLMDLWLIREGGLRGRIKEPEGETKVTPSLPNRFLALVPRKSADELARGCETACRAAWRELSESVRSYLEKERGLPTGWDRLWRAQTESFFTAKAVWVPRAECTSVKGKELFQNEDDTAWLKHMEALQELQASIPKEDRYDFEPAAQGGWQMSLKYSAALMGCEGNIRHIPQYAPEGWTPAKCSLMGTYEQMGPAGLRESADFWKAMRMEEQDVEDREETDDRDGGDLKRTERLCAISLVKRYAFTGGLNRRLGIRPEETRFESTQEIAKRGWKSDQPSYYAVLMFDGDELGKWLDGRNSPAIGEIYDPQLLTYFRRVKILGDGNKLRRPVGPALHAAISEALSHFSLHIAPAVVKKHEGTLIYSGGDDVLALLPVQKALACARELREAYSGKQGSNGGAREDYYRLGSRELLTMGRKATASAGLAVAHCKEDMRLVLEAARQAEKAAKKAGRDRLGLTVWRRSGEHVTTHCAWEMVGELERLVAANVEGISDRWAYHLRQEAHVFEALSADAAEQEIRRVLGRSEGKEKIEFDRVEKLWEQLSDRGPKRLEEFAKLCQTASFLARGNA